MRLRNKILLTIGSIILIAVLIITNLRTYSPYYAMHMPKPEGAHPEVYFALLNLGDIQKPEGKDFDYEIPDFNRYSNVIRVYSGGKWKCGIGLNQGKDVKELHAGLKEHPEYNFDFDQNLFIVRAYIKQENEWKIVDISNAEKKEIRQDLLKRLQPIFDKQKKPLFSLQWLFNWIYGDFVNG